jgi:hypothetical protein
VFTDEHWAGEEVAVGGGHVSWVAVAVVVVAVVSVGVGVAVEVAQLPTSGCSEAPGLITMPLLLLLLLLLLQGFDAQLFASACGDALLKLI